MAGAATRVSLLDQLMSFLGMGIIPYICILNVCFSIVSFFGLPVFQSSEFAKRAN
jgi:hypothetical protein